MQPTIPQAPACDSVQWLAQEASTRRYARLTRPRGLDQDHPTAVLMLFRTGTPPREIERVAQATLLLGQAGLPVPRIYEVRAEQRWILQEDLGDLSLAQARADGAQVASYYSEAVSLLECIQELKLSTSPRPPLDARRLKTELHQFATLGLRLPEGPGSSLAAELDQLVELCTARKVVLCHRDYHSRNLMLVNGRVRVLDHQDALPGPAGYDRVSLAYDPYVDLPDDIRDRIAGEDDGLAPVAVQRLAKAIGTFADKGGTWLRFVAPAASQARRLAKRGGLEMPVLDLAFATLAARSSAPDPTSDAVNGRRQQAGPDAAARGASQATLGPDA